jgi:hypothetical protein
MKFSCGRFSRIFPSFVLCAIACAPAQAQTQPAKDRTQAPQAAPDNSSPAPPAVQRGLPILRNADERAWVVDVEYFAPQPGFDRLNRDIDVSDIRLARAWHFSSGWEFELGAMARWRVRYAYNRRNSHGHRAQRCTAWRGVGSLGALEFFAA